SLARVTGPPVLPRNVAQPSGSESAPRARVRRVCLHYRAGRGIRGADVTRLPTLTGPYRTGHRDAGPVARPDARGEPQRPQGHGTRATRNSGRRRGPCWHTFRQSRAVCGNAFTAAYGAHYQGRLPEPFDTLVEGRLRSDQQLATWY